MSRTQIIRHHPLLRDALNLPLDTPNLAKALGIDWTADLTPTYVMDSDANPRPIPGKMALVRSDNGNPLSVVGSRFTPYQNAEAIQALQRVCDPDARIQSARTFGGGEHVVVVCKMPSLTASFGDDQVDGYTTFSLRHGSGSVGFDLVTFRLICSNGAKAVHHQQASRYRHTASIHGRIADLADSYKQAIAAWAGTTESFREMVKTPSDNRTLERIMHAAFEVTTDSLKDETERSRTIRQNKEAAIRAIRRSPTCQVNGTANSVYADLQAVTEWINHERGDGSDAIFGGGADLIERATAEAYAIATA